tara:strand:+ start:2570 stop:3649 length:1080 start_codon:yes stop_codon:yes gene_type:complete
MLNVDTTTNFGNFTLDISLQAEREILVLFGPSGAGKSLTLELIAGLHRHDSGTISFADKLFSDTKKNYWLPPHKREIGYLVQDGALFPHMTVTDNIAFGAKGITAEDRQSRVVELLQFFNLNDIRNRMPKSLSGGQRQRVALARALAPNPSLLLLDEPFSALDESTRDMLRDEISRLQKDKGLTILFVTHDLSEAVSLGGKIAVLDQGRILQSAKHDEIYLRPDSQRVASLTGNPNVFPGIVTQDTLQGLVVDVLGQQLVVAQQGIPPGTKIHVCVRPESVFLIRKHRKSSQRSRNTIDGTILREVARGSIHQLELLVNSVHTLRVDLPAHVYQVMDVSNNKEWSVSLKPTDIHLILDG